jgi:excisionase family DNA binding protein
MNNPTQDTIPVRLAYKLKEAAALLGVSEKSMRRAISRGLIKPSRAFRHVLIPAAELKAFLQNTTV